MAGSRKPPRGSRHAVESLESEIAARLKGLVAPGERLALGLSGGVDSIVLLDVLARLASRLSFALSVVHVNHHLSPNAARWARFCRAACAQRNVPCRVARVEVPRGNSTERAARDARYAVFRRMRVGAVVLARREEKRDA